MPKWTRAVQTIYVGRNDCLKKLSPGQPAGNRTPVREDKHGAICSYAWMNILSISAFTLRLCVKSDKSLEMKTKKADSVRQHCQPGSRCSADSRLPPTRICCFQPSPSRGTCYRENAANGHIRYQCQLQHRFCNKELHR